VILTAIARCSATLLPSEGQEDRQGDERVHDGEKGAEELGGEGEIHFSILRHAWARVGLIHTQTCPE